MNENTPKNEIEKNESFKLQGLKPEENRWTKMYENYEKAFPNDSDDFKNHMKTAADPQAWGLGIDSNDEIGYDLNKGGFEGWYEQDPKSFMPDVDWNEAKPQDYDELRKAQNKSLSERLSSMGINVYE